MAPHPLVVLRHGVTVGEVLHCNRLHLGDTKGDHAVSEETDLVYLLVMVEDVSVFDLSPRND